MSLKNKLFMAAFFFLLEETFKGFKELEKIPDNGEIFYPLGIAFQLF